MSTGPNIVYSPVTRPHGVSTSLSEMDPDSHSLLRFLLSDFSLIKRVYKQFLFPEDRLLCPFVFGVCELSCYGKLFTITVTLLHPSSDPSWGDQGSLDTKSSHSRG